MDLQRLGPELAPASHAAFDQLAGVVVIGSLRNLIRQLLDARRLGHHLVVLVSALLLADPEFRSIHAPLVPRNGALLGIRLAPADREVALLVGVHLLLLLRAHARRELPAGAVVPVGQIIVLRKVGGHVVARVAGADFLVALGIVALRLHVTVQGHLASVGLALNVVRVVAVVVRVLAVLRNVGLESGLRVRILVIDVIEADRLELLPVVVIGGDLRLALCVGVRVELVRVGAGFRVGIAAADLVAECVPVILVILVFAHIVAGGVAIQVQIFAVRVVVGGILLPLHLHLEQAQLRLNVGAVLREAGPIVYRVLLLSLLLLIVELVLLLVRRHGLLLLVIISLVAINRVGVSAGCESAVKWLSASD